MLYEIKNRWSDAVIYGGKHESMKDAVLAAYRSRADLSEADLSGANLSGANLSRANLSGASLSGAAGVNKHLCTPLLLLRDQPGAIRAYKLVTHDLKSPIAPANGDGCLTYPLDGTIQEPNANCDEVIHCAAGINVATLDWCIKEWQAGFRILVVEFTAADIAAIPIATDGKFRLHRCKVVGEKDLVEIGLVNAVAESAVRA